MADTEGFEEFYTATVGRLLGQLFPVTGDLHEAEEVVQEAYARASTHWARLRDYDVPEAWVRRVAMNLAADRGRRLQRQAGRCSGPAPRPGPAGLGRGPGPGPGPRTLPMHQRQAIVLHYLADLPVEEVAATLGARAGTVKSWLARGRTRPGGHARRTRGGAVLMTDLRDHLQELADAATRDGTTPGPAARHPPRPPAPPPHRRRASPLCSLVGRGRRRGRHRASWATGRPGRWRRPACPRPRCRRRSGPTRCRHEVAAQLWEDTEVGACGSAASGRPPGRG